MQLPIQRRFGRFGGGISRNGDLQDLLPFVTSASPDSTNEILPGRFMFDVHIRPGSSLPTALEDVNHFTFRLEFVAAKRQNNIIDVPTALKLAAIRHSQLRPANKPQEYAAWPNIPPPALDAN